MTKDAATAREAMGLQGASEVSVDGLPASEVMHSVGADGYISSTTIERSPGGRVARAMVPTAKAPRDPGHKRQKEDECRAVRAMLKEYNALNRTSYDRVDTDLEDRFGDVLVQSSGQLLPELHFQVTFADTCRNLRKSLAEGVCYSAECSEEELLDRFWRAVKAKRTRANSQIILVLDGSGVPTPRGILDRFVTEYGEQLHTIGFKEIWWSDWCDFGLRRRLIPLSVQQ